MTIPQRSIAIIAGCALVLFAVRLVEDETKRYTFGHPHAVDAAMLALLIGLFVTHSVIAGIMWMQRERWLPSDAATFRFIVVKALFWLNVATIYMASGLGVRLDLAALYLMIAATTADLDVRMVRRYWFGTSDEQEKARGTDRQSIALERTATATERTAQATEDIADRVGAS